MADDTSSRETSAGTDSITFHYQKSPDYRTVHVDGAHGGVTPRGYVVMTLYNERNTIPRQIVREVKQGDNEKYLGPEEIKESLDGVMRQLEMTVFMDINTAREFYQWFGQKVSDLEEMVGIPSDERVGPGKGGSK